MSVRLLAIGHDAGRTGAVISLLNLLRWLKSHNRTTVSVVLGRDGEMLRQYTELCPTCVWQRAESYPARLVREVLTICRCSGLKDKSRFRRVRRWIERQSPDVVLANTITVSSVVKAVPDAIPIVTYVHELSHWIKHRTGLLQFKELVDRSTSFLAASIAVKDALVHLGVKPSRINVAYEVVPTREIATEAATVNRIQVRSELGLRADDVVVVASGTMDWRKGPDVFVLVAAMVIRRYPDLPLHFLWVGGDALGLEAAQIMHDARQAGIAERIHLAGVQQAPARLFAASDIFVLTSREDPFPLVCIEAAAAGLPIVCFERAGGMPEFVRQGAGTAVSYLDVEAMGNAVAQLAQSLPVRSATGKAAAGLAIRDFDISVVAPRIVATLAQACEQ